MIIQEQQKLLLELANLERGRSVQARPQNERQDLQCQRNSVLQGSLAAQRALDGVESDILRIQEDERKLRARERDDVAQLSAETDPQRRKDLKHDLYAAKSRIEDLMYELKECHNELAPLRQNVDLYQQKLADLDARIEKAEGQKDTAFKQADRVAELKAQLPAELLAEYEGRRQENGVGVAFFNGRSCSGCAIKLTAAERAEITATPHDELAECPNCGSLLVR